MLYPRRHVLVAWLAGAYTMLTDDQKDTIHSNYRDDQGSELPYHRAGATAAEVVSDMLDRAADFVWRDVAEEVKTPEQASHWLIAFLDQEDE